MIIKTYLEATVFSIPLKKKDLKNPFVLGIIFLIVLGPLVVSYLTSSGSGGNVTNISGGNVGTLNGDVKGDVITNKFYKTGISEDTLKDLNDKYQTLLSILITQKNLTPEDIRNIEEILAKIDVQVSALAPSVPEKKDIQACMVEGDLDCSIKSMTELHEKRLLKVDEDKASAAQSALMLARTYELKFDHVNAGKYYKQAVELDADNPEINLSFGTFLGENGLFNDARVYLEKALSQYRTSAKTATVECNPYAAIPLINLGKLYSDTGRQADAEKAYKEALEIFRRLPGLFEPDLAVTLYNLGKLYSDTGRQADAEKAYKEALEIQRRLPGAYEPDLATTLYSMGHLYSDDTDRQTDAEKAYKEALKIFRRLAKENPSKYEYKLSATLNNLGILYLLYVQYERYEDAESYLKEASEIILILAGKNKSKYMPYAIVTLNNLGALYETINMPKESAKYYAEAEKKKEELARFLKKGK